MNSDGDGATWASWAVALRAEAEAARTAAAPAARGNADPRPSGSATNELPAASADDHRGAVSASALSPEDLRSYRRVRTVIDALIAHQPHPADAEVRR